MYAIIDKDGCITTKISTNDAAIREQLLKQGAVPMLGLSDVQQAYSHCLRWSGKEWEYDGPKEFLPAPEPEDDERTIQKRAVLSKLGLTDKAEQDILIF